MKVAEVEVGDAAKEDLRQIFEEDVELLREALRKMRALEEDPYLGDKLRDKSNRKPLAEADCRKLKFDAPARGAHQRPRYRYRIVYRLEPHEGSPHRVFVIAVAPKQRAYGEGAARAAKRLRELAKQRASKRIQRAD